MAAIAIMVPISHVAGAEGASAPMFAGFITLFSASVTPPGGPLARRLAALIVIVPTVAGVLLGTFLPRDPVSIVVGMAIGASGSVWLRRYGPMVASLGQLGFVTFYYALLLQIGAAELPWALAAAGVGILCGWIVGFVPPPAPRRLIDGGIAALTERVSSYLETAIDLAVRGRRDRRLIRRGRAQLAAIETATGTVTGLLDGDAIPGLSPRRALALRERAFDVQLASDRLARALPHASDFMLTAPERSTLVSELSALQDRIVRRSAAGVAGVAAASTPAARQPDAGSGASDLGRLEGAVDQLDEAMARLFASKYADESELPVPLALDTGRPEDLGAAGDVTRSNVQPGGGRQALQAGMSTGLALLLGSLVSTTHQYWAAMPAFQVLSGSNGETRMVGLQRVLATIAGSGIAFGLTLAANHDALVAVPLLIVSVFFMSFLKTVSKVWVAFWQTVMFATMYDVLGKLNVEAVDTRMLETAIGAGVAIVVSTIVLPTSTRQRLVAGIRALIDRAAALTADAFAAGGGQTPDQDQAIGVGSRELARRLSDVEAIAAPLRHQPGSMEKGGVHDQLTAARSLVYHEAALVRGLPQAGRRVPDAAIWQRLGVATAENFDAARAVLDGGSPGSLWLASDLDRVGRDADAGSRSLIDEVVLMNQALLALVDALSPGTIAAIGQDGIAGGTRDEPE